MAEVNKSQTIRDYVTANPKAKTTEVVNALAKQGVTVTIGLVNTVKSTHNKRQAAKKAAKRPVAGGHSHGQETRSQQAASHPRLSQGSQEGQERGGGCSFGEAGHHDHAELRRDHQGQIQQEEAGREEGCRQGKHRHLGNQSGPSLAQAHCGRAGSGHQGNRVGAMMTPDEQLERLAAELDRLKSEHPNVHGILRLANTCLRSCSRWKWEQHGWTITDGEACGIMNGDDKEQRTALLSVLKGRMIHKVEFVPGVDVLEVVPDP